MVDVIVYRPFKLYIWLLLFTIPLGVIAFFASGFCVQYGSICTIVLFIIGIVCVWLTKVLYTSSNIVVLLEREGLRIMGSRYKDYRYVSWEEVLYAYYARNFKGHLFLLLSPRPLVSKEIKRFVSRSANSSKVCIDDVLVIYIDVLQDTTQLRERVAHSVLNIDSTT